VLNIDIAKQELKEKKFACVVVKNGVIIATSYERGIKPIFLMMDTDREIIYNASFADRVIGKAAALLLVLGKVKEVYADVISESALSILCDNDIHVEYAKKTSSILNREGTGRCIMEVLVHDTNDPQKALDLISEKLTKMNKEPDIKKT